MILCWFRCSLQSAAATKHTLSFTVRLTSFNTTSGGGLNHDLLHADNKADVMMSSLCLLCLLSDSLSVCPSCSQTEMMRTRCPLVVTLTNYSCIFFRGTNRHVNTEYCDRDQYC